MKTSARSLSFNRIWRAGACLRSSTMLRLLRFTAKKKAPMSGLRMGPSWRVVSPSGGSTLMTSAPRSPSCWAAHGPSTTVVQSTTRTPASGPGMTTTSLRFQAYLFHRCGPRIRVDEHERGLRHPRPDAARPDVLVDGPEPHPFVEQLLDLVEERLPLFPVRLQRLLLVEGVDVRIGAVGVGAVARHRLREAGGGVAVERARADADPLQLLGGERGEVRRPLHRPELHADADRLEVVDDPFA